MSSLVELRFLARWLAGKAPEFILIGSTTKNPRWSGFRYRFVSTKNPVCLYSGAAAQPRLPVLRRCAPCLCVPDAARGIDLVFFLICGRVRGHPIRTEATAHLDLPPLLALPAVRAPPFGCLVESRWPPSCATAGGRGGDLLVYPNHPLFDLGGGRSCNFNQEQGQVKNGRKIGEKPSFLY
jgi:hypothetical protein